MGNTARLFAFGLLALGLTACSTTGGDSANTSGGGSGSQTAQLTQPVQAVQSTENPFLTAGAGDRVFFPLDRYDLNPEATSVLEKQAAWLRQNPTVRVIVEGHADERGTREYNLALSQRRAESVRRYLETAGIDTARVTTIAYGKERPAVAGSNEAAWAQNRRAVTVVN
ncbi:peptidoglycan-associated lipoprotein Pal [Aerophototrophica crusticola]|uniref:Peptidoglycan-associated lipoprotein n=1 Tax=Aerophototrophica crusticola TaxID=1709002 RepID=A0A858R3V7_9PROT|nr:peptidoglycan-associated lipoprotein Pal [Rhodospirillaceae bacterium B3]